MENQELYQKYALALSLVPDADAAGDLFMDARDEPDLRRRAERWRKRNGLPGGEESPPQPLDRLQREFALHLARRASRRRQGRVIMSLVLGIALVASFAAAAPRISLPATGLAAAAPFREDPLFSVASDDGLVLAIHRMEGRIGRTEFWWSVEGAGAADLAEGFLMQLCERQALDVLPVERRVDAQGKNRLVGYSAFRTRHTLPQSCSLTASKGPGEPVAWQASFTLPLEMRAMREIPVFQHHADPRGVVILRSVSVGADYVVVDYETDGPVDLQMAAERSVVVAGGVALQRWGQLEPWKGYASPVRNRVAFGPLPPGTEAVAVLFPWLPAPERREAAVELPAPEQISIWSRLGMSVTATMEVPHALVPPGLEAYLVDTTNHTYPVETFPYGEPAEDKVFLAARVVPPDNQLSHIRLVGWARPAEPVSFHVRLVGP